MEPDRAVGDHPVGLVADQVGADPLQQGVYHRRRERPVEGGRRRGALEGRPVGAVGGEHLGTLPGFAAAVVVDLTVVTGELGG